MSAGVRRHGSFRGSRISTQMSIRTPAAPPADFDFIIGDWQVRHRRLNSRMTGCTEWTEFSGTSSTRKILGGFGNVEDNRLNFPDGEVKAAAFRSFDQTSGCWAIWWLDGRAPHNLDVPVVGRFSDCVRYFLCERQSGRKAHHCALHMACQPGQESNLGASVLWRRREDLGAELGHGVCTP